MLDVTRFEERIFKFENVDLVKLTNLVNGSLVGSALGLAYMFQLCEYHDHSLYRRR